MLSVPECELESLRSRLADRPRRCMHAWKPQLNCIQRADSLSHNYMPFHSIQTAAMQFHSVHTVCVGIGVIYVSNNNLEFSIAEQPHTEQLQSNRTHISSNDHNGSDCRQSICYHKRTAQTRHRESLTAQAKQVTEANTNVFHR